MPASSRLQDTQLTFTNTSAATGGLSFNADAEFEFDKHVVAAQGVTTTGFVSNPDGSVMPLSVFDTLTVSAISGVETLALDGSTSGTLTVQAAATTTSHTLTLPSAQGDVNAYLKNDGTGALSWVTIAAGDASGPASSTDNAVARFNLTTGKLLQNSGVTISDDNAVAGAKSLAFDGSTSGTLTVQAAATTTSHTLTLPAAQGDVNTYLKNDGAGALSWVTIAAGGDASGPASSTDNAVARFNLTTGKLLQNSGVTISDDNVVAGAKSLAMSGSVSGTFTMQPASTVSSYTVTMPATQGAKGSSLVNNGSGSLAWQLAGQGGLCWSSAAHGNPTVAPQSILGVFSGSAYWSETNVNGVSSSFVVLTPDISNQTGACNWNVPSFDFARDFILRVGFVQNTGASGVQFGVGGSTPFTSASTANGGLAFSYNTAPNNTNWTLNGSTVGKTVGFLDGVLFKNVHMTSCLVVKTFLDKRVAVLYHGDNGAVVNAYDCTAWQPGGQYVFVGARTVVSNAAEHVCKDFSLEYI